MPISPVVKRFGPSTTQIFGDGPPSSGRWSRGDICWNDSPAGGPLGWICTAGGTPGTWQAINVVPYSANVIPWGPSNKAIFTTAPPTTGTWARGDIAWNTQPSAAGPPGWVCVAGGTPGTWKAMANVAA